MTIGMIVEMLTGKKVANGSRLNEMLINDVLNKPSIASKKSSSVEDVISNKRDDNKGWYQYNDFKKDMDATPYSGLRLESIQAELAKLGVNRCADEIMYDGMTGEPLSCLVFMCPAYYQRLKHMTIDKAHSRSKGGRTTLMRGPTEGKTENGGLKCGTMERDMILALGATAFLKDRMMEQSDEYRMWVCDLCGLPAMEKGDTRECLVCETNKVSKVRIPYATKLVFQELMAMNIVPRIIVSPYDGEVKAEAVTEKSKLEKIALAREKFKAMAGANPSTSTSKIDDEDEALSRLKKKVDVPKKVSLYRKTKESV